MAATAPGIEVDDRRLPDSAREARDILQSIRLDRGFLGDEHEEELSHVRIETRQAVKRLAETARRKTAKYTNSIAGELYSSKSRFIYELLQNADDSEYDKDRGEPCITISLYPNRILIDTNETGFTIANVKAICDTGESSKKSSAEDKSIGEKGYGFKSVFGVADRARIQSGYWSFYFDHREGDDGLGMITPIDIDLDTLPNGVTTRIELSLKEDPGDLFQRLSQALTNLHETTIFFLQKIKIFVIHIYPNNGSEKSTEIKRNIVSNQPPILDYVVSLTRKDTIGACKETIRTQLYHVRRQYVLGMPVDKHRKGKRFSVLRLAFPFDLTTELPIIDGDGQHVFAYLPLYRKPNLPFLIQGDFITSTSRESVLECAWNARLRASIAVAFCGAIQLFYGHDILRYQWLKYLPVLLAGGFEASIFSLIKEKLLGAPVFQTWQSRNPARPSQLRILPASFKHHQAPLFEDLQEEAYLAPEYSHADHSVLNQIGIPYMTQHELLERLVYDLGRLISRFRSTPATDPWHETCSSALVSMLSSPMDRRVVQIIQGQKIIPLRSASGEKPTLDIVAEWISALDFGSRPVFFSETHIAKTQNTTATRDSLFIPRGLHIRVLHEKSSIGPHRHKLFAKLGVTSCAPSTVTDAIFQLHRQWDMISWPLSVQTLVSHLQYLFWFRDFHDPINLPLHVVSGTRADGRLRAGLVTNPFYMKSDSPFDTWSLLRDSPELERDKLAIFVSDQYTEAESSSARSHGRSWLQWLEEIVRLQRRPPLLERTSYMRRLSPIMLHILKNRPACFIPTLQAHWVAEYQHNFGNLQSVKEILSQTEVPCERTSPTALSRTYIPTNALKAEAERIGMLEHTPFLGLPGPVTDENRGKWDFLSAFGVGTQADLAFYLDLLSHAQILDYSGSFPIRDVVVKVYTTIGKICNWDKAASVKQKLTEGRGIYVPSKTAGQRWRQPDDCLWNAPSCISIKSALANHYGDDKNISTLFRTYLGVQDVHANDYLDQLRYFKRTKLDAKGDIVSHEVCAEVYQELHNYQAGAELLERMRQVIESEKLIFANGVWHSPSDCLWSSDTSISDQVSIGGIYTDSKTFFVSKLRVKMLTTAMLVSDLKRKATAKTPLSAADAKSLIFKINTMLASEVLDHKLQAKFNELKSVKCFPVRGKDDHITLTDASADFAIVDNKRFGNAFGQEADLLDFSLDDVHVLRPFIEATGITDHYISRLVKEVSEIEGNPAQNAELTLQLQGVAYALFCCAVHFKSSKIIRRNDSLYNDLLSVQVHEAEKMGTSLVLEQHGRSIRVPSTRTQLKIDTATNPWKVYVPKNGRARKACYSSQLPQAMLELLGISEINATLAVNRLVNELHDHESESSVLEQFDVLPISWIQRQPAPPPAGLSTPASGSLQSSPLPSLFGSTQGRDFVSISTPVPSSSSNISTTSDSSDLLKASANTNALPLSSTNGSPGSSLFGGSSIFGNSPQPFNLSNNTTPAQNVPATPLPTTFGFGSAAHPGPSLFGSGQTNPFGSFTTAHRRSVSASPGVTFNFGSPPSVLGEGPSRQDPMVQKEKYKDLLDNIIRRVLGDNRVWSFNDLAEALPEMVRIPMLFDKDETFGVRNDDHLAHDMKIGAAGEVFVFEKLLAAGLPAFTRNNWLSTIRHEAKVHERYKDMPDASPDLPAGSRAEPADIVYADPTGDFAKFLETQKCVGLEDWLKTPSTPKRKYFIEVKTTTQGCDAVFHMSKAQHSRMLEMRKKSLVPADDVYIICRVYNLLSNDIDMRFYVSPGRGEEAPSVAVSNGFNFDGVASPFGAPSSLFGQEKPILRFTSKGFEVRPVK